MRGNEINSFDSERKLIQNECDLILQEVETILPCDYSPPEGMKEFWNSEKESDPNDDYVRWLNLPSVPLNLTSTDKLQTHYEPPNYHGVYSPCDTKAHSVRTKMLISGYNAKQL
jgi:hypothetical protein